jgi:hypothetical protein
MAGIAKKKGSAVLPSKKILNSNDDDLSCGSTIFCPSLLMETVLCLSMCRQSCTFGFNFFFSIHRTGSEVDFRKTP